MNWKRKLCAGLCLLMLGAFLPGKAAAEETAAARELPRKSLLESASGCSAAGRLFDGYRTDPVTLKEGARLTLKQEGGIGSLYLYFGWEYGSYTVINEDTGETGTWGGQGILHEFLDLEEAFGAAPERVTLCFDEGDAVLMEIRGFSSGAVPEDVQKWELPAEGAADLVLFSTHGDDEQLFFAGMIPYYSGELGYQVQVVYMTDHRNVTLRRVGEMLDGLWAAGLRTYPVFGSFGDYLTNSRQETYQKYAAKGIGEEEVLEFVVENIRRFRPKVAVGHDLNGEYGHGMHMVYADALCEAVEISQNPEAFPESAQAYGVWDVPKTYLHLYEENPVVLDWDQPLERFDGMTAYEVTRDLGFPCHISQQEFYRWYFIGNETAADIVQYSPREFGLYRTTVGADVQKNDLFENVTTYAQDAAAALAQPPETEPVPETREATQPQTMPEQPEPDEQGPEKKDTWVIPLAAAACGVFLGICAGIVRFQNRKKK